MATFTSVAATSTRILDNNSGNRRNLAFCRARNFRLVKIVASEAVRLRRPQARGQAFDPLTDGIHAGESEIEDAAFDFTVENDVDDPAALYAQLDDVVGAKLG